MLIFIVEFYKVKKKLLKQTAHFSSVIYVYLVPLLICPCLLLLQKIAQQQYLPIFII